MTHALLDVLKMKEVKKKRKKRQASLQFVFNRMVEKMPEGEEEEGEEFMEENEEEMGNYEF